MKWIKRGRIFQPSGEHGWMNSHAQVPTAIALDDCLRVYFASRPEPGLSLTSFIDLDRNDPSRILQIHDRPILELGGPGMFDEHGILPNHAFWHEGKVHLLYVGWSRRHSIPYSNWMGLAVSDDGGTTFRKGFKGPVLDRTPDEVYSATGFICQEVDGYWHGWYATGTQWLLINGRWEHTYELRYCGSKNLVEWSRPNQPIFPARLPNESNTRPTLLFRDGRWHMWFCYRGTEDFRDGRDSYRIGYASSTDLLEWQREDDNAGIEISETGWDSTMMAYPCVVETGEKTFLFYNGNGFGQAGFGYAELESTLDGI
jgi:hypothetical protein